MSSFFESYITRIDVNAITGVRTLTLSDDLTDTEIIAKQKLLKGMQIKLKAEANELLSVFNNMNNIDSQIHGITNTNDYKSNNNYYNLRACISRYKADD